MGRTIANVTVERGTGMDVGCKRDALATVEGSLKRIGNGAQREVYSDARGRFVYKLERPGYPGANRDEFNAFMSDALKSRGLSQYGSPVALYTVHLSNGDTVEVLAMPMRPHDSRTVSPAALEKFAERGGYNLPDMHDANWRVSPNGRIKITDLGFGLRARW